ncbi:MAG: hypothetical protein ABT02_13650 [Comamonadaceae bacterium SCN 68-20]|nr:hypothetical protein [Comamonadaceae bacterium]ODU58697.1 MAG: hypothetical protein ABT02_13650 [Comamonadaceae bacterium SCN 68-20]OJX33663.1 MAG: hypothetical protein BGO75_06445 [Burkholderiales bacterium 68-20]
MHKPNHFIRPALALGLAALCHGLAAQGIQPRQAEAVQPRHAEAVQPRFAGAVQPRYAESVQPRYAEAVQPRHAEAVPQRRAETLQRRAPAAAPSYPQRGGAPAPVNPQAAALQSQWRSNVSCLGMAAANSDVRCVPRYGY